jgi:mono/diheme cytochrome c family protein
MKIEIVKKIGKAQLKFEVEDPKMMEAMALASFYTTMPDTCGKCQSTDVELQSQRAQGKYLYVKVHCLKCHSESSVGQREDGKGAWWKEFEKWTPAEQN